MITQEFRPQQFKNVAGQELVKSLLQSIVKNPDTAPKSIILQGEYGTGKTTCARIFAKALNCKNKTSNGDACGMCESCKANIENTLYYDEFDSAMTGNVSDIKELKETFYFDKKLGYKVIVLDEAQLMTPQAQSALLKILEESNSAIFFILCTTHIDKILPTIRSRSLKLRFDLINDEDLRNNLLDIIYKKQIKVSNDIIEIIIDRCRGHVRDAHMLLDQYFILGDEQFKKLNQSSRELYYKLIIAIIKGDKTLIEKIIEALLSFPLYILKYDYEQIVLDIIKVGLKIKSTNNIYLQTIIKYYGDRIFSLIDILNDKKIYEMFTSDKRFQIAMYILVQNILNTKR